MSTPTTPKVLKRAVRWRWVALLAVLASLAGAAFFLAEQEHDRPPPGAPATPAPDAPGWFQDVTASSGVDFTYHNGEEAGHYAILESLGGGVALLDYDGDGKLDIFVTGGGYFDGPGKKEIKGLPSRLYRNLGGWKFQDVTAQLGLDGPLFYSHGAAVADYNRDGWPDLLVTGWGRLALYRNDPVDPADPARGRRFREVTHEAGLDDTLWSTSAAWGDLDGDGYPDLYVCHYVNWSFANHPACGGYTVGVKHDICPPRQFAGLPHALYRNQGGKTFTDVSASAGLRGRGTKDSTGEQVEVGKGLGVLIADLNGDRRPDVYVANDAVINFLYMNRGPWRLEEVGLLRGVACDDRGVALASMGIDVGDYNHSGLPSLFVTTYENEQRALFRGLGEGEQFLFSTAAAGIAAVRQPYVGWGTAFVDVDGHGWEDLVIANGHVARHPAAHSGLRQPPTLLRNRGGTFADATGQGGPYFRSLHRGRGLAVGDLDNDGRPDLVVSHVNEPVALLRNLSGESGPRNSWLGLQLVGAGERDTVGARVTVEAGGQRLTRFVKGGGSYLSSGDTRLLFGLEKATRVDRVTVDWPFGETQPWNGTEFAINKYWLLAEGRNAPEPWRGRVAEK